MKDLDRQGLAKAKALFETGDVNSIEVGSFKGLLQIHKYLFTVCTTFPVKLGNRISRRETSVL